MLINIVILMIQFVGPTDLRYNTWHPWLPILSEPILRPGCLNRWRHKTASLLFRAGDTLLGPPG